MIAERGKVLIFPRRDTVFARLVREFLADAPGPQDLQAHLRTIYPRCVVRGRETLADLTEAGTWYVYRDGGALADDTPDWWLEPGAAEATFRDGGTYVTANDEFCAIYGLPPGGAIGRRWDEFATPEAMRDADALWRRMVDDGWPSSGEPIGSTFTIRRPDGSLHEIEYRTLPLEDGTFRTWHRSVQRRPEDRNQPGEAGNSRE